jgi:hypothetical protein
VIGEARREKLLGRLRAALPAMLDPGEQPLAVTQALVPLSGATLASIVAVLILGVAAATVAVTTLDGIWASALFGGLIGGTIATMSILASRWIVVTDRRLLVISLAWTNAAPRAIERGDPRSILRVTAQEPKWGGTVRATIAREGGPDLKLRAARLWARDLAAVVATLSAPSSPVGPAPMPPPPGP